MRNCRVRLPKIMYSLHTYALIYYFCAPYIYTIYSSLSKKGYDLKIKLITKVG